MDPKIEAAARMLYESHWRYDADHPGDEEHALEPWMELKGCDRDHWRGMAATALEAAAQMEAATHGGEVLDRKTLLAKAFEWAEYAEGRDQASQNEAAQIAATISQAWSMLAAQLRVDPVTETLPLPWTERPSSDASNIAAAIHRVAWQFNQLQELIDDRFPSPEPLK